MTSLDKFSCSLKIYGKEEQAFRMDDKGDKDMRLLARLGTCKICDYFIIRDDTVVLVEKTDIFATKHKFDGMSAKWKITMKKNDFEEAKTFIDKSMRDENVLKVFGSLLALCRISSICEDVKNIFHKKKYDFWLIDDKSCPLEFRGNARRGNARVDDNFKDRLRDQLAGVLSDKAVGKVLVLPDGLIEFMDSK